MLQVGSSWTTLRTTLPPHGGSTSTCSSVVYEKNKLVVVGAGELQPKSKSFSGTVLKMKDGMCEIKAHIPKPGYDKNQYFTSCVDYYSNSHEVISATAPTILLQNRYLYAVVCNTAAHSKNIKKNAHGYTPQEVLCVADVKEYLEKSMFSNVMDYVGGFFSSLSGSGGQDRHNSIFWRPVAEMEDCGSATTASTAPTANTIFCVGGYQTLSPKFYQVFSAKERVSCAARMLTVEGAVANAWKRLPDMNVRRKNCAALVVGHFLYAMGGQDDNGRALASVERLDLSLIASAHTAAWEPVASMKQARYGFSATSTGGTAAASTTSMVAVVVAGGCNSAGNRLNSVEYLVHSNFDNEAVWKPLPNLQEARMGASLSIVNSKLVVAGGTKAPGFWGGSGTPLDTIETLDIIVQEPLQQQSGSPTAVPVMASAVVLPEAQDTTPIYEAQQQSTASLPVIHVSSPPPHAPSAPPLEDVYHIQSTPAGSVSSLPAAVPPPRNDNAEGEANWESISPRPPSPLPAATLSATAMPPPSLPPPVMPPAKKAAAAAAAPVSDSDSDLSCAICLERKKQVAFYCGHQVCLVCSPLVTECHVCRKPIEGRIQLYGD